MVQFYCVKCRAKKEITEGITEVTLKNGKPAMKAVCPTCSTKTFRIGKG